MGNDAEVNRDSDEAEGNFFDDGDPFSKEPLYLALPFNRLVLTSHYNGAVFDVMPIDFPSGRPHPLPRFDELTVRFVNNPHKEFQVKWNFIERIDLFYELVFEEFQQRLDFLIDQVRNSEANDDDRGVLSNRFESLFEYLCYFDDYKKDLPTLAKSYRKYLFEEAVFRAKSKDYLTALARFMTLFQEDRSYPGLERAAAETLDIALNRLFEEKEYVKCRQRLERFRPYLSQHAVFLDWQTRLNETANRFFDQAKKAEAEKNYLEAYRNIDEALDVNPELPALKDWKKALQKKALRIFVGVDIPLPNDEGFVPLPDWGRQRGRRLLREMFCEYDRPSLEGGIYLSELGTLKKTPDNPREFEFLFSNSLSNDQKQADRYDIAETLEVFRNENEKRQLFFLFSFASNSADKSSDRLLVRLNRPFPLPESLFAVPLLLSRRLDADNESFFSATIKDASLEDAAIEDKNLNRWKKGLYDFLPQEEGLNALSAIRSSSINGESDAPGLPAVLMEKTIFRSEEAVEQLLSGKIDVLDRLAPWDMEQLKKNSKVLVGKYTVPTVHFIVPNLNKPLTANRTFRRALLYGLNRSGMLGRILEKGGEGIVSSVPFVRGRSIGDPLGYACDPSIRPRPYEPKLAIALALSAFNQIRNREPGWNERVAMPELILARPEHERAEYVALLIRRQWAAIGVPVRIISYHDEKGIGRDDNVDFWLIERNVREPLVDAPGIFGSEGLCGKASPYMELALEKLYRAENWPNAAQSLQEIHRLCYDEVSVLPLWQLVEYYAHRSDLSGISTESGLIDLYQHISRWQDQTNP